MAKPTVTSQQKIARQRGEQLRLAEKGLMSRSKTADSRLNRYVLDKLLPTLDIEGGKVKNTAKNLKLVNRLTGLKKFMRTVVNQFMFGFYDKEFGKIDKAAPRYFNAFGPTDTTTKTILERGSITNNGFMDSLFDNNAIVRSLQNSLTSGVNSQQELSELSTLLTEQIKGKENKLGLVSSFHSTNGRDSFQAYSRTLDNEFSTALDLNYAIYAGGEINDTRQFCADRTGLVFNRETILGWNTVPKTWQGRKPQNEILIDMGGYNCRHDFDWISWELAKRIDKTIVKSEFDK